MRRRMKTFYNMVDPNRNSCNIPEEILLEILIRLPVKSLCRFRCVCKSWLSIISNPKFVEAHLARSKSRPKLLISYSKNLYSIDYPEASEDDIDDDLSVKPPRILHAIHLCSVNWHPVKELSSASSGLICCTCFDGTRIGNPITGDFDLLHYPYQSSFLGFDPVDKRHVSLNVKDNYGSRARIRLLSLPESQFHWIPSPDGIGDISGGSICINGVIYFTASSSSNPSYKCLCAFDVRLENFEMIQIPPKKKHMVSVLTEYKGRVAWVVYRDVRDYGYRYSHEMKLWVLEDPKKHCWSCKSFVIPWERNNSKVYARFFGGTPRGDLIFATALSVSKSSSIDLYLYEVDTSTLRRFKVDGFGPISNECCRVARFDVLIESLHSPKTW